MWLLTTTTGNEMPGLILIFISSATAIKVRRMISGSNGEAVSSSATVKGMDCSGGGGRISASLCENCIAATLLKDKSSMKISPR
jgi:hypothetical protein